MSEHHRIWTVTHLFADGAAREHELGRWGAAPSVDAGGLVTYPGSSAE